MSSHTVDIVRARDTFNVILNSERMSVVVVVMLEDVSEVLAVC